MRFTFHLIVVSSLLLLVFTEHLAVCKLITMKMMKRVHHEQKEGIIHPHYLGVNRAASDVDTPLYGAINVTAEYYAAIELGKSQQSFTVQVDTGSSTLAVPAVGCTQYTSTFQNTGNDCGHNNPFYSMDSATFVSCAQYPGCICQDESCVVELAYGDGSFLVGPMVVDQVTVAGLSTTAHFGAVKAESQAFGSRTTDGIMGIAYTKLSAQDGDSIIDKLVSDGLIDNAFGMCLGYTGGIFTLGGYDTAYSAGPMTYTPIIDESYYVVQVTDILLGSTSIGVNIAGLNGNHSIVDSGTTLLILNDPAFDGLISMFQSTVCPTLPPSISALCHPNSQGNSLFTPGICYSLTLSDIMLFPNITIQLSGAAPLTIGPLQYFLAVSGGFCWGISPSGGLGTILGDVFMQAFNIHFDRANKQVGFAPVQNCIGVAGTLSVAGGDSQSGPAGKQLSDPLKVQVVYENGKPVIGAIVAFTVDSGSADLTKPNAVTDSNGYATTTVTPKSFGSITVKATLFTTDSSASFTLKGTGLPLAAIIGIVVGGVALIVAVTVIVYLIRKRMHKHRHGYMSVNDSHH